MELLIERLGARGDGVAREDDGMVYVPFALPGERVRTGPRGHGRRSVVEILAPSPSRVEPVCRHFGTCGGCQLQHLAAEPYLAWKREQVRIVFAARGLDVPVSPVLTFPHARRRRAAFAARRSADGVVLGLHRLGSHEVIGLAECPVLASGIEDALPALGRIAAAVHPRASFTLNVLHAENGLDVQLTNARGPLHAVSRERLAGVASAANFRRLTEGREPIYATAEPFVRFGPARVSPPPGAFVQAMAEAEHAMTALAAAAIGKAKRVADLFCGLGAFTFPLATRAGVLAVDGDKDAIAALLAAARRTPGLKRIETKVRDLFREPLSPTELKGFDAVVLDPPHAGASAQAEALARSKVPAIVAVSCNPATLARDLRILVDGGYQIESVAPLDQFRYSAEIEVVTVLRR